MVCKSSVGGPPQLFESNHFHRRTESLAELNVSRNLVVTVQDLEKLPYLASGKRDPFLVDIKILNKYNFKYNYITPTSKVTRKLFY